MFGQHFGFSYCRCFFVSTLLAQDMLWLFNLVIIKKLCNLLELYVFIEDVFVKLHCKIQIHFSHNRKYKYLIWHWFLRFRSHTSPQILFFTKANFKSENIFNVSIIDLNKMSAKQSLKHLLSKNANEVIGDVYFRKFEYSTHQLILNASELLFMAE